MVFKPTNHPGLVVSCLLVLFLPLAAYASDPRAVASELIQAEPVSGIDAAIGAHKTELDEAVCKALLSLGDDAAEHSDFKKAISIYTISRKVAEAIGNRSATADSMNRIAMAYESLGDRDLQSQNAAEALALSRESSYQRGIADALVSIGDVAENNGKLDEAIDSYQKSLAIYKALDDKAGMATALNDLGIVLTDQANYQKADDYFRQSLSLREEIGDARKIAATLNDLAGNYYSMGDFLKSIEYYSQSLKYAEALNDKKQIAVVTFNIGATFQSWGDYHSALESFQRSLQVMEELGLEQSLHYVLFGIGTTYKNLGNYSEALKYHQRGLVLSQKRGDKHAIADGFCHLGAVYFEEGNYSLAAGYTRQCVEVREASGLKDGLPDAFGDLGKIYSRQGNRDLAFEYFQKGLDIAEQSGQQQDVSIILNLRGYSYFLTLDYERAAKDYNAALSLSRAQKDKPEVAATLRNLGYLYLAEGKFDLSRDAFQEDLDLSQEMDSKNKIADALYGFSELYVAQGDCEKSVDSSSRSARLAEEIDDPEILWRALTTLGKCQASLDHSEDAFRSFDRAIGVIDGMRLQVGGGEEEQQRFFEDKLAPYDRIVALLIGQNRFDEALHYAERAKARVLDDVLQEGRIEIKKAMTQQEQQQEQHWIEELVSLNTEIRTAKQAAKPDVAVLSSLNKQLAEIRSGYETFRSALYDAHPELEIQRGKTEPPDARAFRDLLRPGDLFLEYTVTDTETFLFVVKQNPTQDVQLKVYRIQVSRKDLAKQVDAFRLLLSRRSPGFGSLAHSLYNLLIKPAQADLETRDALIVVPDRELWGLPFQALQDQRDSYLLEKHAISFVPSLTILRDMAQMKQQRKTPAAESLLAFGNPRIATSEVERAGFAYRDQTLAPIPETEHEVRALLKLYGPGSAKVYTGEAASEARWKEESGKFDILHLAAHGILDSVSPLHSHIVLSHPATETGEDGLLEAWEIMQMNLSADLVVLSACETALGRIGAGEGMIGLSWAFFVAGSKATLVSQWKVESESTAELMVAYYKNLREGASKARALQLAALSLSKNNRSKHPFCWAGFVLIGDPW